MSHGRFARAVVAIVAASSTAIAASRSAAGAPPQAPTLRQLVGQTILVRMRGPKPTRAFLERIRLGEIGGVVLFSENYGAAGPSRLIQTLQAAARAGHQPPLLIAIDQEGGLVKRLPGAPSLAPPEMRSSTIALAQGLATGRLLAGLGVNTDLAPVLDVGRGGFITPRTFGHSANMVASRGVAFAKGLARGGILATAKHFPGLGYATTTTDTSETVVTAPRRALEGDLIPFRKAVAAGIPLVMVSTASYPSLGDTIPAACSPSIVNTLLRHTVGFKGVAITDALDTPAVHTSLSTGDAAVAAIQSGIDMVLAAGITSVDAGTAWWQTFHRLTTAAQSGEIPHQTLAQAYTRIMKLKASIGSH